MTFNVIFAGVGGQGVINIARTFADAAVRAGNAVRTIEYRGHSKREGSVSVHVRLGDTASAIIPPRSADLLLASEPLEALRYLHLMNSSGIIISHKRPVYPILASLGMQQYPDIGLIYSQLCEQAPTVFLDFQEFISEYKLPVLINVAMLGFTSGLGILPIDMKYIRDALSDNVPLKAKDMNLNVLNLSFERGKQYGAIKNCS